jgi:hypothetical protein
LLGFFLGAASGAIQFWLLSKFTGAVTRGSINSKVILIAVSQLFLPIIVLVSCTFLLHLNIMWTGVGIAGSLIVCALTHFMISLFKRRGR